MTIVESPLSGHLTCLQSVLATDLKHLKFAKSTFSLPCAHLVMKEHIRLRHSVKANALGAPPHQLLFDCFLYIDQQTVEK